MLSLKPHDEASDGIVEGVKSRTVCIFICIPGSIDVAAPTSHCGTHICIYLQSEFHLHGHITHTTFRLVTINTMKCYKSESRQIPIYSYIVWLV